MMRTTAATVATSELADFRHEVASSMSSTNKVADGRLSTEHKRESAIAILSSCEQQCGGRQLPPLPSPPVGWPWFGKMLLAPLCVSNEAVGGRPLAEHGLDSAIAAAVYSNTNPTLAFVLCRRAFLCRLRSRNKVAR